MLNFVVGGTAYTGTQCESASTNPVATPGNGQVTLSWTGSSGGATSYDVYRSTTSGSGYTELQPTNTATSYTDTTVTNGTTYYYVITAVNNSGQSGYSSQVSATPFWWGIIERHDRRPGQRRLDGSPVFATSGATEVAGYVGAAQNGSFSGESRAGLGTSIGEAFSLSNATNLTDFELNESGGAVTPKGGTCKLHRYLRHAKHLVRNFHRHGYRRRGARARPRPSTTAGQPTPPRISNWARPSPSRHRPPGPSTES